MINMSSVRDLIMPFVGAKGINDRLTVDFVEDCVLLGGFPIVTRNEVQGGLSLIDLVRKLNVYKSEDRAALIPSHWSLLAEDQAVVIREAYPGGNLCGNEIVAGLPVSQQTLGRLAEMQKNV